MVHLAEYFGTGARVAAFAFTLVLILPIERVTSSLEVDATLAPRKSWDRNYDNISHEETTIPRVEGISPNANTKIGEKVESFFSPSSNISEPALPDNSGAPSLPYGSDNALKNSRRLVKRNTQETKPSCEQNYKRLRKRLQKAKSGDTVRLRCDRGAFCATSRKQLTVKEDNVQLKCNLNTCPDGQDKCIIKKKKGVGGRLLWIKGSDFLASDIEFQNGSSRFGGGAVMIAAKSGTTTFRNCRFRNNKSDKNGGALRSIHTKNQIKISGSTFVSNTSGGSGGAAAIAVKASMRESTAGDATGSKNKASDKCANGIWYTVGKKGAPFCQALGN